MCERRPHVKTSVFTKTAKEPAFCEPELDAAVKAPLWSLSVMTGAKSFTGNPIIGGERLNRLGLYEARMRTAARLARHRRGGWLIG